MALSKKDLNEKFTEQQLEEIKRIEETIDRELLQGWTGASEEVRVYFSFLPIPKIQNEIIRRYHEADENWEIYFFCVLEHLLRFVFLKTISVASDRNADFCHSFSLLLQNTSKHSDGGATPVGRRANKLKS